MKRVIAVILLLLASHCFAQTEEAQERELTGDECAQLGGEIINTLDGEDCGEDEYLGEVIGMRCPCLCCRKQDGPKDQDVK